MEEGEGRGFSRGMLWVCRRWGSGSDGDGRLGGGGDGVTRLGGREQGDAMGEGNGGDFLEMGVRRKLLGRKR